MYILILKQGDRQNKGEKKKNTKSSHDAMLPVNQGTGGIICTPPGLYGWSEAQDQNEQLDRYGRIRITAEACSLCRGVLGMATASLCLYGVDL